MSESPVVRVANVIADAWRDEHEAAHAEITALRVRVAELERENMELRRELSMWKPMTDEEAERAYDEAEAIPMSREEIERIVRRVIGEEPTP